MQELRSYKKAFGSKKAAAISALLEELEHLDDETGYRLYISEIQGCLQGGLLLAAVSVVPPLVELFVRDLIVAYRILRHHEGDMRLKGQVEREFEEQRELGFSQMLQELQPTVIKPSDATKLREFYEETRVPFAHALLRRLTRSDSLTHHFDDLFSDLARRSKLEDRIEDGALRDIQFVVEVLKTYQPWLLRRLRAEVSS